MTNPNLRPQAIQKPGSLTMGRIINPQNFSTSNSQKGVLSFEIDPFTNYSTQMDEHWRDEVSSPISS